MFHSFLSFLDENSLEDQINHSLEPKFNENSGKYESQKPTQSLYTDKCSRNKQNNLIDHYYTIDDLELATKVKSRNMHNRPTRGITENTNKQNKSFNSTCTPNSKKVGCRLYEEGMQMKQRLQQEVKLAQQQNILYELGQCKEIPQILKISKQLVHIMQDGKKRDFLNESNKWNNSRDEKLNTERRNKRRQLMQNIAKFKEVSWKDSEHLPINYKGPVEGFHERNYKYMQSRKINSTIGPEYTFKPNISKYAKCIVREKMKIEDRLIETGHLNKLKMDQKRYEKVCEELKPLYQTLKITPTKSTSRISDKLYEQNIGNLKYPDLEVERMANEYTFKPKVNEKSARLAKSKERKPLYAYETAVPSNNIKVKVGAYDREEERKKREKISDFLQNNYVRYQGPHENKTFKCSKSHRELAEYSPEHMQNGMSFRPEISKKSITLAENLRRELEEDANDIKDIKEFKESLKYSPVKVTRSKLASGSSIFECLHKEREIRDARIAYKKEAKEKEQGEREIEECCFHPNINKTRGIWAGLKNENNHNSDSDNNENNLKSRYGSGEYMSTKCPERKNIRSYQDIYMKQLESQKEVAYQGYSSDHTQTITHPHPHPHPQLTNKNSKNHSLYRRMDKQAKSEGRWERGRAHIDYIDYGDLGTKPTLSATQIVAGRYGGGKANTRSYSHPISYALSQQEIERNVYSISHLNPAVQLHIFEQGISEKKKTNNDIQHPRDNYKYSMEENMQTHQIEEDRKIHEGSESDEVISLF